MMAKQILIVDDLLINRKILEEMLRADYDIIQVANGKDALSVLSEGHNIISAVLLDISMPDMDGYEVLRRIRSDSALSQMPVIMITGNEDEELRIKSLALGANDFVMKPYNSEIIRHCLRNNIALHEASETVISMQTDNLTGLYNRDTFFEKAQELIAAKEGGYYILSCFDIDNFKLINDQFGNEEGDNILRKVAQTLMKDMASVGGIAGRINGDNFASLIPVKNKEVTITHTIKNNRLAYSSKQAVIFSEGRYIVTDPSFSVSKIYDRAYIAKQSVKGRYDKHIAYFDDTMMEKIIRSQDLTGNVDIAMAECQFEVWYQPQYNHSTGAPVGAEALVRWHHPEKGIIPPNDFIPVFENNGFVYDLDKFVWKEVCKNLRKWLDEGRLPLPVSVNVSRYDIFRPDIIDVITGLVKEYNLSLDLLRLEITETAFSESSQQIIEVVKKLVDIGFIVEIDDFGSGYSSLNTLKDVPAQVIKLDMKFLESNSDTQRGGNIMKSVIGMAKLLGMSVIAEGVETIEQADYLRSIGCSYMQGFFYAKPMPVDQYEKYCKRIEKEERHLTMEIMENANREEPQKFLLDNLHCETALYEYDGENLDVIHPDDKIMIKKEIESAISQNQCAAANIIAKEKGKYLLFVSYTPKSKS